MRALVRGSSLELGRRIASLGFIMVLALFFLGFLTIGGEFFYMWSSSQWNGTDPAFRNTVLASFGLILVHFSKNTKSEAS